MEYFKIDPKKPDPKIIDRAVEVIKNGGIIVYPTDTLYGLGVDILNDKALRKLFLLKKRNIRMPISFIETSIRSVEKIIGDISKNKKELMNKLVPGKFTILTEQNNSKLNLEITTGKSAGKKKVGFRIPDYPICTQLSKRMNGPISSTSANISGQKNVFTVTEVIAHFGNKLDLILDAGKMKKAVGSTVIDFTKDPYLVIREGEISFARVKSLLPEVPLKIRKSKFKVTFICSGNICRSPMGEGILKGMIEKSRFKEFFEINSAGTLNLSSIPAHDFSLKVSDDNDVDISAHRSQVVSKEIMEETDLIFCMALNHLEYLRKKFPEHKNKIILLREWKRENRLSNPSIGDPIGHNLEFFQQTFSEIHSEIKRIFPFLMSELKAFMDYNELN